MSIDRTEYAVVLPVKPPGVGKTRLVGITAAHRISLATAFAIDTLTACLAADNVVKVLVTTDDARFAAQLTGLGAHCCPDGGQGLNAALVQAVAEARRRWPGLRPAALCADLPALRPAELTEALASAGSRSTAAYVADVAGRGTTLYTAPHDLFAPRFGAQSAAAHDAAGALRLAGDLPGLRHDVDDLPSLWAATALGVGRATRAAIEELPATTAPTQNNPPKRNGGPTSR